MGEEKAKEANPAPSASLQRSPLRKPSWVSPSPLSVASLAVVVSSVSSPTSTKKPAVSSALSSRTLSVTPSPTPNTPRGRPSPLSMSSTLLSAKAAPFTVSADERFHSQTCDLIVSFGLNFKQKKKKKKKKKKNSDAFCSVKIL